ncbi:alpha/beta hydrolase [Sesbania bispinosa]|nr:alpha/beta hydrolase [Sesbania bispinosa]
MNARRHRSEKPSIDHLILLFLSDIFFRNLIRKLVIDGFVLQGHPSIVFLIDEFKQFEGFDSCSSLHLPYKKVVTIQFYRNWNKRMHHRGSGGS